MLLFRFSLRDLDRMAPPQDTGQAPQSVQGPYVQAENDTTMREQGWRLQACVLEALSGQTAPPSEA